MMYPSPVLFYAESPSVISILAYSFPVYAHIPPPEKKKEEEKRRAENSIFLRRAFRHFFFMTLLLPFPFLSIPKVASVRDILMSGADALQRK